MTTKELKKLRSQLPHKYGRILSERTGKHPNTIYRVVNGELNSPEILDAAIELAMEEIDKQKKRKEIIENLSA